MQAQIDSSYIKPFDHDFAVRWYFGNKITAFDIELPDGIEKTYGVNAPTSIGVGVSWKDYSFAFSKGFDFLRDKQMGKTNSLEFQYHGYKRKFAYDIYLQHHNGFYDEDVKSDGTYELFPDVSLNMYGGSFLWVFNNKRFSYKAAFSQNERQLKSAGSFQLGASAFYTRIKSDSTEIFRKIDKLHQNLQFGINGGYAYTWVLGRRWTITMSMILGAHIGNNTPQHFFKERMEVYPYLNNRFAATYNMQSWSFGVSSYFNQVSLFVGEKENMNMNDVNMQITFIKRLHWGNKYVNDRLNQTKRTLKRFGL